MLTVLDFCNAWLVGHILIGEHHSKTGSIQGFSTTLDQFWDRSFQLPKVIHLICFALKLNSNAVSWMQCSDSSTGNKRVVNMINMLQSCKVYCNLVIVTIVLKFNIFLEFAGYLCEWYIFNIIMKCMNNWESLQTISKDRLSMKIQ